MVVYPQSDSKTSAVLVVIEDSYIGHNPGAVSDLVMMSNMVSTVTDDIVVLKDGQATRRNVKDAIAGACSNDLAIVFFTCHGGHERARGESKRYETDGYNEYVFLSDTSMTDDELWDMFKCSTGRVFTVFNCCHAGTMFRASPSETQAFAPFATTIPDESSSVKLMSWSACGDDGQAATSKDGGLFVQSICNTAKAFGQGVSYREVWTVVRNSSTLRRYQRPEINFVGDCSDFEQLEFLK